MCFNCFLTILPTWDNFRDNKLHFITGYDEVFVKEMPYRYRRYIDLGTLDDIIPQDYVHVFLIRNPLKAIPSMFRLMQLLKAVPEGKNEPFVHLIRKEMKVLNSHMV